LSDVSLTSASSDEPIIRSYEMQVPERAVIFDEPNRARQRLNIIDQQNMQECGYLGVDGLFQGHTRGRSSSFHDLGMMDENNN